VFVFLTVNKHWFTVRNTNTGLLSEIQTMVYCQKYKRWFTVRNTNTGLLSEIQTLVYCQKYTNVCISDSKPMFVFLTGSVILNVTQTILVIQHADISLKYKLLQTCLTCYTLFKHWVTVRNTNTGLLSEIQTLVCCQKYKHWFTVRNTNTGLLSEIQTLVYCQKYKHWFTVRNTNIGLLSEIQTLIYCQKYKHWFTVKPVFVFLTVNQCLYFWQ
jgi:hypothetical protein